MASVKFLLNRPKSDKPTSILVRFHSLQTQSITLSTGEMIPPAYWDGQRVSSKYRKQYDRINKHLSQLEADLLDLWRDNKGATSEHLAEMVKKTVKGGQAAVEKKTVVEAVKKFIAQYSQEKEGTTVKMYKTILKKLEAFNPDLGFEELDFNFYDAFKTFLYNNPNPVYSGYDLSFDSGAGVYTLLASDKPVHPVGLFDDAVFKYIVHIKTICAWAEKRGYQVNPSYKTWEIIKREYPVISLTLDELHRIEALQGLPRHLEIARDYLSIACRTGQRISDVKRISSLAISSGIWTVFQKKGSRVKQKEVHVSLVGFCAPVIDIVNKHGGQLPASAESNLNVNIKEICKRAGITQEIYIERWQGNKKIRIPGKKYEFITSHCGKKTFITILGGQGVPVKVISDLTGTSIKTIEKHYLGKTDLYVVDNYLKKIESPGQLKKVV